MWYTVQDQSYVGTEVHRSNVKTSNSLFVFVFWGVEEDLLQNQQITIKLYTIYKRQRHRHKNEQYNREKERKEREWQPHITSECSSYYPRLSSSTYIRA